jgi:hypothetical protein
VGTQFQNCKRYQHQSKPLSDRSSIIIYITGVHLFDAALPVKHYGRQIQLGRLRRFQISTVRRPVRALIVYNISLIDFDHFRHLDNLQISSTGV